MSLQLHQDQADFIFYDVDGNILYQYSQWSLRKAYLPTSFNAEE
jgi:tartrate-resistant acid phosphatase type 5